jgi:hypothetical protein
MVALTPQRANFAFEALHQFVGSSFETTVAPAAIAETMDREPIDALTPGIELGDEFVDLAWIEGEARCHEPDDSAARRRSGASLSHACNSLNASSQPPAPTPAGTAPRR